MFWDIYSDLCKKNKKSPTSVSIELGFTNAACSKWKKGTTPNGKTLQSIADYFGVTTSYLLGETHPNTEPPQPLPDPLPPNIAELAEICEQLAKTKSGAARLQLLLEEAQRLLEETQAYEQRRKNAEK